ncbi:hypothetical protein KCP73_06500 [Salmonella enterica subsp. enterica]|nr:hypothetical protein KCP73_06500 [Salmonella enterica subsp. enterica]
MPCRRRCCAVCRSPNGSETLGALFTYAWYVAKTPGHPESAMSPGGQLPPPSKPMVGKRFVRQHRTGWWR